jgi:5'-3' exonuclease
LVDELVIEQRPRLFLIDGSSYIFRAYYAIPSMNNSAGLPTNGIFGFTNILLRFLKQYKPEYVVVALDAGRETFRNQIFAGYKTNRPKPPADLLVQFPYFRHVLECLNVPVMEMVGYEADDIIATLCDSLCNKDCNLVVVSTDKDVMQLVTDDIRLLDSATGRWMGVGEVESNLGVAPG